MSLVLNLFEIEKKKSKTMLTDMTPTAGQFYGSQIPTMGMNITNIANHMQKPTINNVSRIFIKS